MGFAKRALALGLIACCSLIACESDPRKPAKKINDGLDLLGNCADLLEDLNDLRDNNNLVGHHSGISSFSVNTGSKGGGAQGSGSAGYAVSQGDRDNVCNAVAICIGEGYIDPEEVPEYDDQCFDVAYE